MEAFSGKKLNRDSGREGWERKRKRKMNEGKGERESDATKVGEIGEEARGRKANGERGRLRYILYYVGRSERKGARWEDKDGVDAGYRSVGLKTTLRGRGAVCKTDHVRVGGARGARGPRGSLRSLQLLTLFPTCVCLARPRLSFGIPTIRWDYRLRYEATDCHRF